MIVDDPLVMPFVGDLIPPVHEGLSEEERARAKGILARCAALLHPAKFKVTTQLREGDPKHELPKAAEEWGADCIFVGSTGFSNRLERFVLGSVSAAVCARAHCSVEVVRKS
jgi:nucleotide-binding universal stress UspA family protein